MRLPLLRRQSVMWLLAMAALAIGAAILPDIPPAPPSTAFTDRPLRVGVNVALEQADDARVTATLDAISAAGLTWVRQRFPWNAIEPQPGVFDWTLWDRLVDAVSLRGLQLIAVLDGSPAWARPHVPDNPFAPPHDFAAFGRFVATFAARYGDRINYYQIWDEPNIQPHWSGEINPAGYVALLREGALAVRRTDPGAIVLTAALAPTLEQGPWNLSDVRFLREMYRAGAAPWFDVLAAQPFGFEDPPDRQPAPEQLGFARVALLRAEMVRAGDADKPIWGVRFGWHTVFCPENSAWPPPQPSPAAQTGRGGSTLLTLPPMASAPREGLRGGLFSGLTAEESPTSPMRNCHDERSIWGSVSPAQQAAWAEAAVQRARTEWPWLGALLWATWQPATPSDDPLWGFALVGQDGAPRHALAVLSAAARPPAVVWPGRYDMDHPALHWEGRWRRAAGAADVGRTGDELIIPFWGTRLDLRVQRGNYWALLWVEVDGEPANALPHDTVGRSYLVLYDSLAHTEWMTVARNLPLGKHQARLTAEGGWGQWALSGFAVAQEPSSPTRCWGVVGILAAVIAGVGLRRVWSWNRWTRWAEHYEKVPAVLQLVVLGFFILAYAGLPWPWAVVPLLVVGWLIARAPGPGLASIALAVPFYYIQKPTGTAWLSYPEALVAATLFWAILYWHRRWRLRAVPHAANSATAGEKAPPQSPPWRRRHRGEDELACPPPLPVCAAGEPVPRFSAGGPGVGAIFRTVPHAGRAATADEKAPTSTSFREPALSATKGALFATRNLFLRRPRFLARKLARNDKGAAIFRTDTEVRQHGNEESEELSVPRLLSASSLLCTLDGAVLVFTLVGLAAAWAAPDHSAAWLALRRMVLAPAGLYLLWRLLPVNRQGVHWTVGGLITAGVIVSLIGLAGYINGTVVTADGVSRLRSVYYSPNEVALLLVRVWLLAASLVLTMRGRRRWLMAAAMGLMLLALALTFSRGAWLLGVPAGLLALAVLHRRWRLWPWFVIAAVGIGLILFSRGGGTALRPEVWQAAWAMWRDHPWLGVGLDGFQWAYPRYMALSAWREPLLYHPHNFILEIGTWMGILGLLAMLALGWTGVRAWRQAMQLEPSPVLVGLAAGMIAGWAHGLVDAAFFLPHLAFLTMITLGMIMAYVRSPAVG